MEQPKDPQKELEISIHELEERVDRLRSLYEQYFMGYEKVEPTVQRKDVDRRFVALRKLQIRNTAIRFRFNVVTQRFNTYAMYWTRICRQIEEGSYKRHIVKAERRFADRPNARAQRNAEADLAIDVDLADFEESDIDQLLAEADAAASVYGAARGGGSSDTEAPPRMASDLPDELAGAIVPLRAPAIAAGPASSQAQPRPHVPAPVPTAARAPAPASAGLRSAAPAPSTAKGDVAPPPRGAVSLAPPLGRPTTPNDPQRLHHQVALPPGARAIMLRRSRPDPDELEITHPPPPAPAPREAAAPSATPARPAAAAPAVARPYTPAIARPHTPVAPVAPVAPPPPAPPPPATPAIPGVPPSTRSLGKQPPLQRFVPTPQVPITPNAVPRGQGPLVQRPPGAPARPPLPSGAQATSPTPASPMRPAGTPPRPPPPLPSQGQPKKPSG